MPVQIQFRRDTAANWTSANPTLAAGELGLETDTLKYKIGDGTTAWASLSYASLPSTAISNTVVDAKGDILVGTADNTVARQGIGANNTVLVADSAQTNGLKWSSTLASLTLTTPTVTGGTLTSTVIDQLEENWNVAATAATGTINFDVKTSSAWYYTSNASANWTVNVRGNSSTSLSSLLDTGDSLTIAFAVTQGSTAYYNSAVQIDGSSVTPKWQGGAAPTSGNASSVDMYVYTIIKTAATPTYTVFAAQTKFA